MSNLNISNRYATAFYENAKNMQLLDTVAADMRMVQNTLEDSKELRNVLASPVIKEAKKNDILKAIFGDKINHETQRILSFIIDKKRFDMIIDIVRRFNDIHDENMGIANAEVITASETDSDQKDSFKIRLENFTQKKLRMKYKVDSNIIGGFQVKISDTVIDATLSNQLKKLKKKLLAENISSN